MIAACRDDQVYQLTDDEVVKEDGTRSFEDTPFYKEHSDGLSLDQLRKSVQERYPEVMKALAENEKAETPATIDWNVVDLARDMCRGAGHDPDLRVLDTQNAQRGPLGSTLVHATVPAWTLYIEAAQNVKGALNG